MQSPAQVVQAAKLAAGGRCRSGRDWARGLDWARCIHVYSSAMIHDRCFCAVAAPCRRFIDANVVQVIQVITVRFFHVSITA